MFYPLSIVLETFLQYLEKFGCLLYMREKLNSKHGRGANDNQWTLMMEGVSHPFHQENPQMGFSLRPFNFGVLSPQKDLSVSSLFGSWLVGIGRGFRISLFSMQPLKKPLLLATPLFSDQWLTCPPNGVHPETWQGGVSIEYLQSHVGGKERQSSIHTGLGRGMKNPNRLSIDPLDFNDRPCHPRLSVVLMPLISDFPPHILTSKMAHS